MGRLIAIVLGGAALAFYVPAMLGDNLATVNDMWKGLLGEHWYGEVLQKGGGVVAGLGLVLLAIRSSKE